VIVELLPRSATRQTVRGASRLGSAALAVTLVVALAACANGDAPAAPAHAHTTDTSRLADVVPPTEVVIARPSSRYQVDPAAAGASITGTVTAPSSITAGSPVTTGRDSAMCGPSVADESVVRQGNGLGGAVVWLDDIRRGRSLPLERRLELESDKCRLTPRVQGAVVGSAVNVIGHGAFRQHLRFLAGGEREPRASVLLGDDEQVIPTERPFTVPGLVVVKDADHPWVASYLAVFDHPYFAITAPDGTFKIDGVPPGHYTLRVWHERTMPAQQPVDVSASGTATATITLRAR
jgi:hypothetical protein